MLSCNPLPVSHAALPYFTAKTSDAGHAQACTVSTDKVIKKKKTSARITRREATHMLWQGDNDLFLSLRKKLRFLPPPTSIV